MRCRAGRALAAIVGVLCWGSPPLPASEDHEAARDLVNSGTILPLEAILDAAYQRFPGRLLEAELEREDGQLVYELEILTERGQVLELLYDARKGTLIKAEQED